jgi:O-antigen ligase
MIRSLCTVGNRLFDALVLGAVVWSTVALGGAWELGMAVTFGLMAAATVLWAGMRLVAVSRPDAPREASSLSADGEVRPIAIDSRAAALIAVLFAYLTFQLLPLPAGWVAVFSPTRAEQEAQFRQALGLPAFSTLALSIDPAHSRNAMAIVGLAAMGFTAGAYIATSRRRVRRAVMVLLGLVCFEAVYGLVEELSGRQQILWIPVSGDFARGTFFNRNHYAALLALYLPLAVGWCFHRVSTTAGRARCGLPLSPAELLSGRRALWLLLPPVIVLGIIQSQSRGGFAAMVLGLVLMAGLTLRSRVARSASWLALPLVVLLFAYALTSEYQLVFDRFGGLVRDGGLGGRAAIWQAGLPIVRDYPLFGVGLGNFPRIYMQYAAVDTANYPYQAHNEWLEGLIVLGMVGMVIVVVAVAAFFVAAYLHARAAGRDRTWLLGAWCGLVALAFHCFGEFNLHIPAIALSAALLAGMLVGYVARDEQHSNTDEITSGRDSHSWSVRSP